MYDGQVTVGECGCGVDAVLSWEPWAGGNELKEPTSLAEVIDQAVPARSGHRAFGKRGCMLSGPESMSGLAWGPCEMGGGGGVG